MGVFNYIFPVVVVLIALYMGGLLTNEPQLPVLEDGWWGKGPKTQDKDPSIRPFTIAIPDFALKDLKDRLQSARLGEDLEDGDFHYGFQVNAMQDILSYWKDKYSWRFQEKVLNSFPQYKTRIEGIDIHFLNVPPTKQAGKPRPLIVVHGWPGSVYEFYKMIPLLSAQGFHIICPSIPGYGFSEAPRHTGFAESDAARIFHKLMQRLNFQTYYAQGGDFGSRITSIMAQAYPESVLGLHVNMPIIDQSLTTLVKQITYSLLPSWFLPADRLHHGTPIGTTLYLMIVEGGYFHIQATKPDTVGIALNDSPVGLAAYILEKFSSATNLANKDKADGGLTEKFTLDELLTNVMIYWFSGNVKSSLRLYKETMISEISPAYANAPIHVPSGVANFPHDIVVTVESLLLKKYRQLVQYSDMPQGGHFAALEEPDLLATDIVKFVQKVEKIKAK